MAACDAVVTQSQKYNAQPEKSVFGLMEKIAKSREFINGFEIDVSNLREKKALLRAQMLLDPDTVSEIEINAIDNDIEYKQTILRIFWEGMINPNEEFKKLMNTDGKI